MEEKGYYKSYDGRVLLCENQQWILDKVLIKIIIDAFNRNLQNIPNARMSTSTSLNIPHRAPFKHNKRFPNTGKYARFGVGSVWYTLFEAINKFMKHDVIHTIVREDNFDVPKLIINEMMKKFYEEEDMFNRETFEKTMNIQWVNETSKADN